MLKQTDAAFAAARIGPYAPAISIVVAAYNRSHLLRFALKSIVDQTFTDFEVLVIGDACTDDSEQVVAEFGDDRLQFHNMALNFGDQSGPNNVGIAMARGRYVAFLNQDDFWLPDHLETCLHWLEATGSDMVHGIAARISVGRSENIDDWVAGLNPAHEHFDPTRDFAACSTWLVRREVFEAVGGFRSSREIIPEPSQDLLFRIWRRGLSHRRVPNLSIVIVPSGERAGSYVSDDTSEHEAIARVLSRTDFRSAILSRVGRSTDSLLSRVADRAASLLLWPFAWVGIAPRAVRKALSGQFRRGSLIRHLRSVRGLEAVWHVDDVLSALKAREADLQHGNVLGRRLEFAVGRNGGIYLGEGWSHPETGGTWTNGPAATLRLPVRPADAPTSLALEIEAIPFVSSAVESQRLILDINGMRVGQCRFGQGSHAERMVFEFDRDQGEILEIAFHLPDAHSPKAANASGDKRKLGLFVRAMTVDLADT